MWNVTVRRYKMGDFWLTCLHSSCLGKLRDFRYSPYRLLLILNVVHANFENVALNKPATQWTTAWGYQYAKAENAVDGQKSSLNYFDGQCSISGNGQTIAEWLVDLGYITDIHNIIVTFRTDNLHWDSNNGYRSRALGFTVYVSNTLSRHEGTVCFKDTNHTIYTLPLSLEISCPVPGRYVIFYNERLPGVAYPADYSQTAFLELCEVEVYACPRAFSGENCSLPCPQRCQNGDCKLNGDCFSCITGYKGLKCDEHCGNRTYGENCLKSCGFCRESQHCHSDGDPGEKNCTTILSECDHVNGTCMEGCGRGYRGENCTETCPVGFYGYNCEETCNEHCGVPGRCDGVTGECQGGCQPGWIDQKCDEHCGNRTYGINCSKSCGFCRESQHCHSDGDPGEKDCTTILSECDHVNGTCMEGCGRGYRGENCTETCPAGVYGYNCQETCNDHCGVPGRCDGVTGECQGGCQPGWKDPKCDEHCSDRTYGINCSKSCGFCRESQHCHSDGDPGEKKCTTISSECDHVNGTCMEGCGRGYRGENCTEACPAGFYGYNCEETCNDHCGVPGRCDRVTGECQGGCQPGWMDPKCDEHCPSRTYGLNCSKTCGFCRKSQQCLFSNSTSVNGTFLNNNSVNGTFINSTCLNECDKEGKNCTEDHAESSECDHVTGVCANGCAIGYQGENCTEECNKGFHGDNCSEVCSIACRHSCHHITGLCPQDKPPESSLNIGVIAGTVPVFIVLAVIGFAFYYKRLSITNTTINRGYSR